MKQPKSTHIVHCIHICSSSQQVFCHFPVAKSSSTCVVHQWRATILKNNHSPGSAKCACQMSSRIKPNCTRTHIVLRVDISSSLHQTLNTIDRKTTLLNSRHKFTSRMQSSA